VDGVRSETAKQLSSLEPQFSTLNKAVSALADRVAALEKQKPPSDASLETFKKVVNSLAKDLAGAQSQQLADAKALNNAIAALDKRVQESEKKVKVIETQGGGI
jgi:chromosome segregation ATPase